MKRALILAQISFLLCLLLSCQPGSDKDLGVPGLDKPVEVIRDNNGVNHIYAQNEHDLFFCPRVLCCQRPLVSV